MKYKVGDKVRIRNDLVLGKRYGYLCCLLGHKKDCDKIFTIKAIGRQAYRLNGSDFWWSEEMLEEADGMGNVKIKIAVDGNKVTAKMGKETGIAKCSPDDEFDIFVGAKLALERLEEQSKPYAWLKGGCRYWIPNLASETLCQHETYMGTTYNKMMLKRGIVFRTREEAIAVAEKMLAVLKEE